jgi:S-adenosylmethionine-diacylglycerol 3-amino-3-carboxypropyl transferase
LAEIPLASRSYALEKKLGNQHIGRMGNVLLQRAAHQRPLATKRGALERLFTLMFKGFVYNQIWEDPVVDLEALELGPHHRLITIASGGCNVLNYLVAGPECIIAVDLNPNHIALTRLKLQALEHLPDHESFFRFFGIAKDKANRQVFDNFLADRLDAETRHYWERRMPLRGRRINMFARNLYRYGLLGRFIGILHALARLQGKRLEDILAARTLEEQRVLFERTIAPLFDNRLVRFLSRMPVSYYGLGIPPAQYDELVGAASDGNPITTLRERVERLACDFPISENYFAWQAFGRGYDIEAREAVPPYLRAENFQAIKSRAGKVDVLHASMTDFLKGQPARSLHRYVLLDAQDWMTQEQMRDLWAEIDRTAHEDDARVIFRTAGVQSPLPEKLPATLLASWVYLEDESKKLHVRDRSSIYGGFHIYARRKPS